MVDISGVTALPQASSNSNITTLPTSDVYSPQAPAESSALADDPASSLRAAALLSRKRRKTGSDRVSIPARPIPEATFHLDYGQEEPSSAIESSSADKPSNPATAASLPAPDTEDIEDGQIREEGEISESEELSATPQPQHHAVSPRKNRLSLSAQGPQSVTTASASLAKISTSVTPGEAQSTSSNLPIDTITRPVTPEQYLFETQTYRLDHEHVRPGLDMTQQQYETSKDIILDLLGWGIPPEYLADCGLSRQIVYYVFTELNLRLPGNLETDGIIPYPTPEILSAMNASTPRTTCSRRSPSFTLPPSFVSGRDDSEGQQSLAQRMKIDRESFQTDTIVESSTNHLPSSSQPTLASRLSPNQSLSDIEQLRRQELQARKAVIASRGRKQNRPHSDREQSTSRGSSRDKDIDMVPTETVDDFLKSIGSTSDIERANGHTRTASPDAMDVDETIPGFVTSGNPDLSSQPYFDSAAPSRLSIPASSDDLPPISAESIGPLPLSSSSIMSSTYSVATMETDTPNSSKLGAPTMPPQSRRGTKRPVAADFVDDMVPNPARSHTASVNGYTNGSHLNPVLRRKTGSFASVSGMRRCVIDLSDSEDDADKEVRREHDAAGDNHEYRAVSPPPASLSLLRNTSRIGALSTLPLVHGSAINGGGGLAPSAMSGLGTLSPAALLEKEQEIKRMRELIAHREQSRLKKIAAMSGKSTATISTGPPTSITSVTMPVKQEEDINSSLDTDVSPNMNLADKQVPINDTDSGNSSTLSGEEAVMRDIPDKPPPPESYPNPRESTDKSTSLPTTRDSMGRDGSSNNMSGSITPSIDDRDAAQAAAWTSRMANDLTGKGLAHNAGTDLKYVESRPSQPSVEDHRIDAADGVGASSAQVSYREDERDNQSSFTSYTSPFAIYPLLRPQPEPSSLDDSSQAGHSELSESHSLYYSSIGSAHSLDSSSNYVSSSQVSFPRIFLPDFQLLKQVALQRALSQLTAGDTSRRVCHYEVPSGGVCRDQTCKDVHLSRISGSGGGGGIADTGFEPNDSDTATYVHGGLPAVWRLRCTARDIEGALDVVRLRGSARQFEERVREALVLLGIPVSSRIGTST